MADLGNILNTESETEKEWRKDSMVSTSTMSPTSPTSPDFALSTMGPQPTIQHTDADTNRYRHRVNVAGQHESHPGCPDSLCCLEDTNDRPLYTIPVLISCAILGSPGQRMLVSEIYESIMAKYPYFTSSESIETRFKQSLRHQLSLNRLFEREQGQRLLTRGFYWSVNLAAPPGTKRPRKRGTGSRKADESETPAPKRGRPPQEPQPTMQDMSHGETDELQLGGGPNDPMTMAQPAIAPE
ncbi:hypothetical protein PENSPDRAFT_656008 [Peniophora sp. CONT]|nr:hypothetical protein PENSPDRAFT_656008 [Peniophora sp. CONT]